MKVFVKVLLLIIILGIAFWIVYSKTNLFTSDKDFAYSAPEKISKIIITDSDFLTTLENVNNEWIINGEHAANADMIDNLQVIIEKIKDEYPMPKMYAATLTNSVIMDEGMHIQLYEGNSLKRDYYIYSSDSLDCIGLIKGKQQAYKVYMESIPVNLCDYLSADPAFWQDNLLFSYFPYDIVSVTVENMDKPEQSFRIEHNGQNEYKLFDTYNLREITDFDNMAIKRYLTYFRSISVDSYPNLTEEERLVIFDSDYQYLLTIKTKNSEDTYRFFYIAVNDELDAYGNPIEYDRQKFYLGINDEEVALASWIKFDILLKNLSDFVNK